jgi:hypothetical protein
MANQHTGGKWNVYDEQIKKLCRMKSKTQVVDKLNLAIDTFERRGFIKVHTSK